MIARLAESVATELLPAGRGHEMVEFVGVLVVGRVGGGQGGGLLRVAGDVGADGATGDVGDGAGEEDY